MDEATRTSYETQSKDLRVKIKTWEVNFAKANQGSKPSRQDIKSNRDMAATYKEYQFLRDVLAGKKPPQPPAKHDRQNADKENRKRKSPQQPPPYSDTTPSSKRFRMAEAETPSSRHRHHPTANSTMHMFTPRGAGAAATSTLENNTTTTPSLNRKLFSPVVPTSIGPTPHRDGRVLGLFDMLPFQGADIDSPSKPSNNPSVKLSQVIQGGKEAMITETPKKRCAEAETKADALKTTSISTSKDTATLAEALGRTPSSRHKRQKQTPRKTNTFATPRKPEQQHGNNNQTPGTAKSTATITSVSKLQFLTPAFLRRIPMPKITEGSEMPFPEPIRLPRKPLLRGLSSVVADLRKLQEDELDDEMDNLREIENEAAIKPNTSNQAHEPDDSMLASPSKAARRKSETQQSQQQQAEEEEEEEEAEDHDQEILAILEEDTQRKEMKLLGGFDDEGKYDSFNEYDEANAGLDRNGQPLRVFKKKGQKRTTRRANMRPVRTQRPSNMASDELDSQDGLPITNQAVEADEDNQDQEEEDPALLSGSDFTASDSDEDELAPTKSTTKAKTKPKAKPKSSSSNKTNKEPKEAAPASKKPPRKVNELAHANFKRLKLRNNGAKGGPGYNSRFRRRR